MKHEIFKDVAMPTKLFWAPVAPAGANLGVNLSLAVISQAFSNINPLFFVFLLVIVHTLIICAGLKEPHLSSLMEYTGKIKKKYGQKSDLLCDKYDNDNMTILLNDTFLIIFKIDSILNNDSKVKYLKEIAPKEVCIRFFYSKGNTYLLLSGHRKESVNELIQITFSNFTCEVLTTQSQTTPSDVLKLILNPIEDDLFSAGSSLSETSLLINKREIVRKSIMAFEQNGKKLYTAVLSLQNLENEVDFDFTNLIDSDVSVLEWIKPQPDFVKNTILIEQKRRMLQQTSPKQSVEESFIKAKKMLDNNETFIFYGYNIYVSAQSEQQLESKKQEIIYKAKQNGMILTTEGLLLPFAFHMCLPHYDIPRQFLLPANVLI